MSVTPETLTSALKAAKPGDIIDCGLNEFPDPGRVSIFDGLTDITLKGGIWHGALKFVRCKGLTLTGTRHVGDQLTRTRTALTVMYGQNITVTDMVAESFQSGAVFNDVEGFEVGHSLFSDMKADGFQGAAVRKGHIHHLTVHGRRSDGKEHADAVQLRSVKDRPATSDMLVENLDAIGDMAGVICTQAGGRMSNITIRGIRARVSRINGVRAAGVDGLTLGGPDLEHLIDVGTLPGSERQARISIDKYCTGVVWEGKGTQAAYGTSKAVSFGS